MAYLIKCLNLILGYKGNKYKRYKWILAFYNLKNQLKKRVILSIKRG